MNSIDPRVHQALDGEIPREALPPALRRVAERLESAAALLAAAPEGRSVADRVLARLHRHAHSPVRRLARWLTSPTPSGCCSAADWWASSTRRPSPRRSSAPP